MWWGKAAPNLQHTSTKKQAFIKGLSDGDHFAPQGRI
jgi:hypothetical protein